MIARNCISTGTPGGQWQHRSNHLIGQIRCRCLDRLPGMGGLGLELSLGLAHLCAGSLASGVERGSRSAFRCFARCSRIL